MQRYPQGVLCLLSALAFHELTTQSPPVVWLALPKSAWRKPDVYPPLRILHYSGEAFTAGVETHKRQGGTVRVYSVVKTVADGFKFRNRIGLDVAIEALREGWQQHPRKDGDDGDHHEKFDEGETSCRTASCGGIRNHGQTVVRFRSSVLWSINMTRQPARLSYS